MIVYKIINNLNTKVYIGITSKTLKMRFLWHLRDSRKGVKKKLYDAMRQLGDTHFDIELLEECEKDMVKSREEFYIQKYNSYIDGYNASQKSSGVKQHSLATRQKLATIAKNRLPPTKETLDKMSNSMKKNWESRPESEKLRYANMASLRNKGKIRTDEMKFHQSIVMTGKKHSMETIEKMKKTRKNKLSSKIQDPVLCPHCNIVGKSNAMFRWHFDNCRRKI